MVGTESLTDAACAFGVVVEGGKSADTVLGLYCVLSDCRRSRLKGHDRIPEAFSIAWGLIHNN